MISSENIPFIDDTKLKYEESVEEYYLCRDNFVGTKSLIGWRKPTYIEDVAPDNFLYSPNMLCGSGLNEDDWEWNITYQFPSAVRNPYIAGRQYGSEEMTFRRLYIILCEHFNEGHYFIDDYFDYCYPTRLGYDVNDRLRSFKYSVLEDVDYYYNQAKERGYITKRGTIDKRTKISRGFTTVQYAKSYQPQEIADEMAQRIKDDLFECLKTGIIPLKFRDSMFTVIEKAELGLTAPDSAFYATGQLIDSIRIIFTLEAKQWQTRQGIQV